MESFEGRETSVTRSAQDRMWPRRRSSRSERRKAVTPFPCISCAAFEVTLRIQPQYNKIPNDSPNVPHKMEAFGGDAPPVVYHELKRPFSLYNWENGRFSS